MSYLLSLRRVPEHLLKQLEEHEALEACFDELRHRPDDDPERAAAFSAFMDHPDPTHVQSAST